MKKILIVEDDSSIREELAYFLSSNNFQTETIEDFAHAGELLEQSDADMILLDLTLPNIDGQTLLRNYRKQNQTPVIILTSKNTEMDELICMTYGADDFVAKPYNPAILLLHIEAVFRRTGADDSESVIKMGNMVLDASRSMITNGEKSLELTKNELGILYYLMKNKGKILSREAIMGHLWDSYEFVDDNTLTVNITRVRHKLEELGVPDILKTKRGQGYYIET